MVENKWHGYKQGPHKSNLHMGKKNFRRGYIN